METFRRGVIRPDPTPAERRGQLGAAVIKALPWRATMRIPFLRACVCALVILVPVAPEASRYLFVWAGDAEGKASDFLAVLDVTPGHPTYGRVVASVAAGAVGTTPHHTEYSLSETGFLFANGFKSGRSFIFDVRDRCG
jgi:hypothetical protein